MERLVKWNGNVLTIGSETFGLSAGDRHLKSIEQIFSVQLYLIGCIVSFISIYIVRLIVGVVKILLNY